MAQPVKAKKHLGQHFLCDENIAQKIVEALLQFNSTQTVIEIGPGTGVLTKYLIPELRERFYALDIDTESIDYLKQHYPEQASHVLFADFLEYDLHSIVQQGHFNIIGNFPYNISTQIMFRVLEHRHQVDVVVGMFQKEVAQRIAEKPGSKTYGILSVLLQAYYDIEYLFTVHEHVFSPPPKVKSAVIRLRRNNVAQLPCDESLFTKVVKTAFNQRRKTLRNALKPLTGANAIDHPFMELRAERLSVNDFIELTNLVAKTLA